MGNCDPVSRLNFGDLFVMPNGNSTIRMMSADEFFHVKNAAVQYIGTVSDICLISKAGEVFTGVHVNAGR